MQDRTTNPGCNNRQGAGGCELDFNTDLRCHRSLFMQLDVYDPVLECIALEALWLPAEDNSYSSFDHPDPTTREQGNEKDYLWCSLTAGKFWRKCSGSISKKKTLSFAFLKKHTTDN